MSQKHSEVPLSDRRGLRIKDAATYLGVSPWWVEVAIREKRIPAYKFKTNYYILFKDDLDAHIDRLRAGEAAAQEKTGGEERAA